MFFFDTTTVDAEVRERGLEGLAKGQPGPSYIG